MFYRRTEGLSINNLVNFVIRSPLSILAFKSTRYRSMLKTHSSRQAAELAIKERYERVGILLSERSRRLFAGSEALSFGYGGISAVHRATGLSCQTIRQGIAECQAIESGDAELLDSTRVRAKGGGRKKLTAKYPDLLSSLKDLVESTTGGDPESPLLWTARSQRNLSEALKAQGYQLGKDTVAKLLKELGYSLQGNQKKREGAQHPDRNAQFEHINERIRAQLEQGDPAISVDLKKKEQVGPYKNQGRELRAHYDPETVKAHDFPDKQLGKALPYGVYDLAQNQAWVSVGVSHDTAEFAVATIQTWYQELGAPLYPNAKSLLITADAGGSNGYRVRLWKVQLQQLANQLQIPIKVCHLPPGTSKWNKIEHRLFSFISQNWRGKPLISHQVIVELIAATTTKKGLEVHSRIDPNQYPTGKRVSEKQIEQVYIEPDKWHGEWNYTIHPQDRKI